MASDAVVTEGLTRRFGSRVAVNEVNLHVRQGDVYGFLGPNGAGKTTAIRCILGLIRPSSGRIGIFGETDPVRRRRGVGAMVEAPSFHKTMSARENLEIASAYATGRIDGDDILSVIKRVGLEGREGDKVGGYSQGMRQRLGIARALLGQPRLLVLDEPTNGLDPRGMKEVRDLLLSLAKSDGLTILVSSHLLHEVELLCNRVGVLQKGTLVAQGDVVQLQGANAAVTEVDVASDDLPALRRAIDAVPGASLAGDGEAGRIRLALSDLSIAELNKALVERGVPVEALVPVTRSLEDLYLKLTTREVT